MLSMQDVCAQCTQHSSKNGFLHARGQLSVLCVCVCPCFRVSRAPETIINIVCTRRTSASRSKSAVTARTANTNLPSHWLERRRQSFNTKNEEAASQAHTNDANIIVSLQNFLSHITELMSCYISQQRRRRRQHRSPNSNYFIAGVIVCGRTRVYAIFGRFRVKAMDKSGPERRRTANGENNIALFVPLQLLRRLITTHSLRPPPTRLHTSRTSASSHVSMMPCCVLFASFSVR